MRKGIILVFILAVPVHAKQIVFDIPDKEITIVEHDVINAEAWLRMAWQNKVRSCTTRIIRDEMKKSIDNKETIPAGEDAITDKFISRPDYESRQQRDTREAAEARAKREAVAASR